LNGRFCPDLNKTIKNKVQIKEIVDLEEELAAAS